MPQDWNTLVASVLSEFSSDPNEQALLRQRLRQSNGIYHLAFGGLMTGFGTDKVKALLRRELQDMTEESKHG